MTDAHDIFNPLADMVNENTSEEGIDVVNVYVGLIEALKASPDMTLELWETLKLSINNGAAIASNLIDEEIKKLRELNIQ